MQKGLLSADGGGAADLIRDYIAEEYGGPTAFGNARGVRNLFEHVLVAQNNRLAAMETDHPGGPDDHHRRRRPPGPGKGGLT